LLLAHKGTCTEAVLFFPMTGSIKEFRDGFRFFSFIEKRDS
jgi:hypothetical protein